MEQSYPKRGSQHRAIPHNMTMRRMVDTCPANNWRI